MSTTTDTRLSLTVRDLRFGYGEGFALSVPHLDLPGGTTTACIGPSGSGKTTLLHLLAGILAPQSGTVGLGGVTWSSLGDARRRLRRIQNIGLVFQEFELLEHLTVRENVLLPYFVQPGLRLDATVEHHLRELTAAAGIERYLARKPQALSQGERQRVAICRALIARPSVVLADEPTGNLDPHTTETVLDLLLEQVAERGASLIMVTHDHSLLARFEQRIEFAIDPNGATVRPA